MRLHPDQMGHHRPFKREQQYRVDVPPYLLRVVKIAALGLTNREMGKLLGLTERGVKTRMYDLNKIFHTASRTALVIEAMKQGYAQCPHGCRVGHPPPRLKRPASSVETARTHQSEE